MKRTCYLLDALLGPLIRSKYLARMVRLDVKCSKFRPRTGAPGGTKEGDVGTRAEHNSR